MTSQPDYYEILQVDPTADQEVIEAAYRRLVGEYDPAAAAVLELNKAFKTLGDPKRRAQYDRQRAERRRRAQAASKETDRSGLWPSTLRFFSKRIVWAGIAVVAVIGGTTGIVLALTLGGGGGGPALSDIIVEPGRVSCDAFRQFESYRYKGEVAFDLEARDPAMEPTDGNASEAYKLTQVMEGAVQQDDRFEATIDNVEWEQPETSIVIIGDIFWMYLGDSWTPTSLTEIDYFPIPYLPQDTCDAIAPDINVSDLAGEPEMVGEIPSQKYHFDALRSDLPDRHPSFGPQSDVARFVNEYEGDIWIADDGSYISKLDITGTGTYENGRKLTLRILIELSDINDDSIRIEPPI